MMGTKFKKIAKKPLQLKEYWEKTLELREKVRMQKMAEITIKFTL